MTHKAKKEKVKTKKEKGKKNEKEKKRNRGETSGGVPAEKRLPSASVFVWFYSSLHCVN
jgi:hypothetical protein